MKINNILLIFFILFIRCAVQGPPEGGPLDKIPPYIVKVYPLPNSIKVDTLSNIFVIFNKLMEHISVERSIFIAPVPKEKFNFRWEGKKLNVVMQNGLQKNITYVITIGTSAKDLRNNGIENSYFWSFSTGDKIDRGEVSGKIFGEKDVSEIFLWAFKIYENKQIKPSIDIPDYTTQSNKNGEFKIGYLPFGSYRIFALKDINNNLKYDIESDYIGVPFYDIKISEERNKFENFSLLLSKEDTTAPSIIDIKSINKNNILIKFSEKIKKESIKNLSDLTIYSSDKNIGQIRTEGLNLYEETNLQIITSNQKEGTNYYLNLSEIEDLSGNKFPKKMEVVSFIGSGSSDTTAPKIVSVSPEDSSKNLPPNTLIKVQFSEPIDTSSILEGFSLKDDVNMDVSGKITLEEPSYFTFSPSNPLIEKKSYNLTLKNDYIKDRYGNKMLKDFSLYFEIGVRLSFGSISGQIEINHVNKFEKVIVVMVDSKSMKEITKEKISNNNKYKIDFIKPGEYIIFAFVDSDGNGLFTPGKSFPFRPSERFTFIPELTVVRPGWDNEDVIIRFYDYE